jgi:hypothetical protein
MGPKPFSAVRITSGKTCEVRYGTIGVMTKLIDPLRTSYEKVRLVSTANIKSLNGGEKVSIHCELRLTQAKGRNDWNRI